MFPRKGETIQQGFQHRKETSPSAEMQQRTDDVEEIISIETGNLSLLIARTFETCEPHDINEYIDTSLCGSFSLMSSYTFPIIEDNAPQKTEHELVYEGPLGRVYRMSDPKNCLGGSTGAVAIKCYEKNHSDEQTLQNEYDISNRISYCEGVRKALKFSSEEQFEAVFLEWVPGVTLGEWIRICQRRRLPVSSESWNLANASEFDLKGCVRLAFDISGALAGIHDAGVVHNNFAPDNIIVNKRDSDDSFAVKIIGLGSASLSETSTNCKRKDIISLGNVLFELFTGWCPSKKKLFESDSDRVACQININNESRCQKDCNLDNVSSHSQKTILLALINRIPFSLTKLILEVMEAKGTTHRFQSARDIASNLFTMLSNPLFFQPHHDEGRDLVRLEPPPGKLYGASSNLSTLTEVCNRLVSPSPPETVLISGYPGTGKSYLVQQVEKSLNDKGVNLIHGKFDKLRQVEPLSAITTAFTRYCNDIVERDPAIISERAAAIMDEIGAEIGVLTEIIPSLCQLTGKPSTAPTQVGSKESQYRLRYIFRAFMRAIATPSHPIVLFLDDLQWADVSSLDLIKSLVTDSEISYFLFIGCYRSNEIDDEHPLVTHLQDIQSMNACITNIIMSNLSKSNVNELVSDAVHLRQSLTTSLADIVYRKTSGNALLAIQLLQLLWDNDLLRFSLDTKSWDWDSKAIEPTLISDGAANLLADKILQLPLDTQLALKMLSFIGSSCDEFVLKLVVQKSVDIYKSMQENAVSEFSPIHENNLFTILNPAVDEGLLNKEGARYEFSHDEIKFAAHSLVPADKRDLMSLEIGYMIWRNTPYNKKEKMIFIAVDRINQGISFIKNEEEKVELARLNLRAAEKAITLATFESCTLYIETGIGLLGISAWEKYYDLSLRMYNLRAEAEYCIGNFQKVGEITGAIITHAKCLQEKLCAYATITKTLGAQQQLQKALEIGFEALSQLSEHLPAESTIELSRTLPTITKHILYEMSEVMTDRNKLSAVKILREMILLSFISEQELMLSFVGQIIQISASYGICKETCLALGVRCMILSGPGCDNHESYSIGQLALRMLDKLRAKECIPSVYFFIYSSAPREHLKLSIEHHMYAFKVGMHVGDIQYAYGNLGILFLKKFMIGFELSSLYKEIQGYLEQMTNLNQVWVRMLCLPILQLILNMRGCSENPSKLSGEAMNLEEILTQHSENQRLICVVLGLASWVAYFFGDFEVAAKMVDERRKKQENMIKKFDAYGWIDFFDGLIFSSMARKTSDSKWLSRTVEQLQRVKERARLGACNFENKCLLLEAELASILKETDKAAEKYRLAISTAAQNEFPVEQAMACERAGDFFFEQNNDRASHLYSQALNLYAEWGAEGKADHLCKNIPI